MEQRTQTNTSLAQESFRASIVSYLGVGLGFLTTFFVLASYLSPEELGLTRILVELATLLSGLAMFGLSTSINRFFPYFYATQEKEELSVPHRGFSYWIVRTLSWGLPITLILYYCIADRFNAFFGTNSALLQDYYLSVLPLTVFITLWAVAEVYTIQFFKLLIPRFIRELILRFLLLGSYLIYAFGWIDLTGFIVIFVGTYGLCMLLAIIYLTQCTRLSLRKQKDFPGQKLKQDILRYSTLATLSTVGTTLALRMDVFMLAFIPTAGLRSAAVFSIGFFMVSIMEIPTRSIISLASARIAQLMQTKDYGSVSRLFELVSRYQLQSALLIYLLIYANINELISFMPRALEYRASAEVFVVLGLAKLVEVSWTASHPIINTSRYYAWSLYYTLWCIVSAFVANYYFIPIWDAKGAALATLVSCILGYVLLQWVLWSRLRLSPISWAMIRTIFMGLVLFYLIDYLPSYTNPYVSIIVRSSLVTIIILAFSITLRIAPELERYVINYFRFRI